MSECNEDTVSAYWSALAILEKLLDGESVLTSEQVSVILKTRNTKGIGSALRSTKYSLANVGIRLDEAISKRSVRGRTIWTAGPRIRQARHALQHARRTWTRNKRSDRISVAAVQTGHCGPVLVLRALKSRGNVYRIDGGIRELDAILEDDWFEIMSHKTEFIGEVFIDRIESNCDAFEHSLPAGYGENGIWVRGVHDYSRPRVAGAIGTGRYPTMTAHIVEATWVERRVALVDAVRQVEEVRAEELSSRQDQIMQWQDIDPEKRFLYVNWISAGGISGPRSAPPLRMRLRCWYEIVIETAKHKRIVLREEGLRGDDARTTTRAITQWRKSNAGNENELVVVREIRIAKKQPRPLPP